MSSSDSLSFVRELLVQRSEQRKARETRVRMQFEELYAPLGTMLLDCHVVTVTSFRAPYMTQRIAQGWHLIRRGRWRTGLRALIDKKKSTSHGVEFGVFPRKSIIDLINRRNEVADPTLLRLASSAMRSGYERHSCDLTDEEFALAEYVTSSC